MLTLSNVHLLLCGTCTSGRTVGVRGQLCGVASLLPLLLGSQDWTHITRCALQEPLLTKPAPKYILTTSFTMEKFPGFYPNQMTKDNSTRANRYYSSPSIAKTQNHCDIFDKKCISWPYLCRNITWTQTDAIIWSVLLKYWGYEAK